jgi:hypothetical protein
MALVDINWTPSKKDLRVFALLLIVFGAVIASLVYFKYDQQTAGRWVLIVSAALGLLGACVPTLIRPVYVTWMALAFPIGWTISHIMMGIVFYLVITPIGFIMKACGRDPMRRRLDRSCQSYWLRRESSDDVKRYFRQF